MVDTTVDHAPGTGAARRRMERLRAYFRYARMSVAMALAENNHHSVPRRPTMARAKGEESDEMNNAMGQKTAARPTPLVEVRPQPGVLRHTAAHIVDILPYVQILGGPVPQLGDQVVELLQKIDAPALVEQVIAVPKISLDRIPQRSVCRRPRRAEQLVEVPTIVSFSSLQQQSFQFLMVVAIGAVGWVSSRLRPGQNSTALGGALHVDIPVPHGRGGPAGQGGLQGFSQFNRV